MPDLNALFRPRSIALVGASPDRTIIRGRIVEAVTLHGFDGPLHVVSRSHREIAGILCHPSMEALPGPVDLAIVTIPAEHVAATLRVCGNKGVKAVVVISSGFGEERGEAGAVRQREIADIAREFDMAVLGPNAEGFLNNRMPLAATFSPVVVHVENGLRPEGSRGRGIAVVSQSGGVGFSFFHRGRPKALDFSYVVTTGNEAGLDAMDIAEYLVEDDETAVVLAFLEGVRAPGKLVRVAARAAELGKPLVFAKIGRSEAAAAAAASHTASLAGTARSYDAVFRRCGILPGEDQEHMVDVGAALAFFADRLPKGTRVGILTPSGGAGAWLADVCEHHGLTVPVLDAETRAAIERMLPAYGASRNPVDVTAQVIFTVGYAPPLELLANAPGIDAVLVAGSLSHARYIERDFENLVRIGERVDKPVIFCGYTRADRRAVELLARAGFPCTTSMANAAKSIRAMHAYREFLERQAGAAPCTVEPDESLVKALSRAAVRAGIVTDVGNWADTGAETGSDADTASRDDPGVATGVVSGVCADAGSADPVGAGAGAVMCEHDAKALLAAHGIGGIPPGGLALDAGEAVRIAHGIGAPVAMKVQSSDLPHKSESNGIALGVEGAAAVRAAFERIVGNARVRAPSATILGVRVERMAGAGLEMIVGVSRDPDFGPMIGVGFGGVLVEVLDDFVLSPAPVDPAEAGRMLHEMRGRQILDGVRGARPADVDALVGLLVAVSEFAVAAGDALEALDLNPVIVHPRGEGVSVVDAGIVARRRDGAAMKRD
ncbi:MAG: acetate--CoA ligase family protein [Thiotrichales bacterium]|nr:acetate--CoA ligase family protein [Thiotrichales bacterium]